MKKFFFMLFLFFISIELAMGFDEEQRCETMETCNIPAICKCTVTPSVMDRHFFVVLNGIKRGTKYNCTFTSSPGIYTLLLSESTFPQGLTYDCLGETCPQFPAQLLLHTEKIVPDVSSAKISYFVPGLTDIPTDVEIKCLTVE